MSRDIQPVGKNQYGDEVHPAFAMIRAHRVSVSGGKDGGAVLFDSDLVHNNTVRITLETASRKRDLNHDYIHGGKQLIEVEMSEAQWAAFVSSSMNTSGVPATLRWTSEVGPVPNLPYQPRLAMSIAEVREAATRTMAKIREARDAYEQAIADKAGAKAIKAARDKLHYAIENSESNMAFAAESLTRHTENVVTKAKADIEATVSAHAAKLGLTAAEAQGMVALPIIEAETVEAIES